MHSIDAEAIYGDISRALNVSLKTMQNHVSNILNKMQVVDRAQAIVLAVKAGLK
jgi:DNA-binding NarL/FixJ family response regulator